MTARWIDRLVPMADGHTSRRDLIRSSLAAAGAAALATRQSRIAASQEATPAAGMSMAPGESPLVATTGEPLIRKNVNSLSPEEKRAYTDAVLALKVKPSPWAHGLSIYDTFVLWHRDAFNCDIMAGHMGPAFFPWHRAFLLLFEQQLRAVDSTVVVPYWDWAADRTAEAAVWGDDFMGGNSDPDQGFVVSSGPFRHGKWEINVFDYGDGQRNPAIIRDFGAGDLGPELPTTDEVEAALEVPVYDVAPWNSLSQVTRSFRNTMEGWRDCADEICDPVDGMSPICTGPHLMHNRVHLWIAGEFWFAHELDDELVDEGGTAVASPAAGSTPAESSRVLGTMAANTSPNDPVFMLVHANIDRIFSEWLRRHGPAYQPVDGGPVGHNLHDAMWPYSQVGLTVTPAMLLDSQALGYRYESEL